MNDSTLIGSLCYAANLGVTYITRVACQLSKPLQAHVAWPSGLRK